MIHRSSLTSFRFALASALWLCAGSLSEHHDHEELALPASALHTTYHDFWQKKNKNDGRNDESSLVDICRVISRDYIFP